MSYLVDIQFAENAKEGYSTLFTIIAIEPFKSWEFDMANDNIKGYWAVFSK